MQIPLNRKGQVATVLDVEAVVDDDLSRNYLVPLQNANGDTVTFEIMLASDPDGDTDQVQGMIQGMIQADQDSFDNPIVVDPTPVVNPPIHRLGGDA